VEKLGKSVARFHQVTAMYFGFAKVGKNLRFRRCWCFHQQRRVKEKLFTILNFADKEEKICEIPKSAAICDSDEKSGVKHNETLFTFLLSNFSTLIPNLRICFFFHKIFP
jgi:hypothetical protein